MQEIPCSYCGTFVPEANATRGALIDNMSRESYCSEECRDLAEDTPLDRELAAAFPGPRPSKVDDWDFGMADPFAE